MAAHLDLEEQEQLAQLKAFWSRYGGLISAAVTLVCIAVIAWTAWNWWQRDQGSKAAGLFDELEVAAQAKDVEKVSRAFGDLKARFPSATYTHQGGLLAAQLQAEKSKLDDAVASLTWVAEKAAQPEYQAMARLRLAGLLLDQKKYDDALTHINLVKLPAFDALVADRRGDVLAAKGQQSEAVQAYLKARETMGPEVSYRRLIDAKLTALGAPPAPEAAAKTAAEGGR
jgi:predicted negative regulator of RcsB-dependent stress response